MTLQRIGDTSNLLDPDDVSAVLPDENDPNKLTVILKSGAKLYFEKSEAVQVWKLLCKDSWRGEE